ncbi:MAG: ArsR/SmtB family transcription factor [Rhodospirillaceae bacterium]
MAGKNKARLRFPCECVSVRSGYSDPWAEITQRKLLSDGTKERILNSVAREPKTIALLAKELQLSQPSIHGHITDMLSSELLRTSVRSKKRHPAENYYEPNFPVVRATDLTVFEAIYRAMAGQIADIFEKKQAEMKNVVRTATFTDQDYDFAEVAHVFYTAAYREARRLLEERGVLAPRKRRGNGARWIFWAEE